MTEAEPTTSRLRKFGYFSFAILLGCCAVQAMAEDDDSDVKPTYLFFQVQGRGITVCDAFEQRLKATEFEKPLYCDIPENDSVPGFAILKRVPLPIDKGVALFAHVYWFGKIQNQFVTDNEFPLENVKVFYPESVRAWTYDPDVSLNNDGHLEHLLFWQGAGALGEIPPVNCGERGFGDNQELISASPTGFILTSDDKQIDEQKTREFLQHPKPNVRPWPFLPLGEFEGLFEFRGVYYLEIIYGNILGDLSGKHGKRLDSTLAVVLHKNGVAKQICTYRFHERRN